MLEGIGAIMADDADERDWGRQLGHALAIVLPAAIAAVGGYWAKGQEKSVTPTITPAPVTGVVDVAALQAELAAAQARIEELQAKINVIPSDLSTATDDYATASSINQDACVKSLSEKLISKELNFSLHGERLFQIRNARIGQYILCQKNGNVSYYAVGDGDMSARADFLKTLVRESFE